MDDNRPAIPAKIKREILIECGHRCAVCGTPFPLEFAHIIPWRKSKEHKVEDLICLCAGCHERADHENWGELVLYEYKQNPRVNTMHSNTNPSQEAQSRLQINLNFNFGGIDPLLIKALVAALSAFANIAIKAIELIETRQGSVI